MEDCTTGRPSRVLQIVAAITSLASVVCYCFMTAQLRSLDLETVALSGSELLFGCVYLLVPFGFMLLARHVTDEVWRWLRLLVLVLSFLSGLYVVAALWALTVLPDELALLGVFLTACAVSHMVSLSVMCIRSSPAGRVPCSEQP